MTPSTEEDMVIQQITITEFIKENGEQGLKWDATSGMSLWNQIGMLRSVLVTCEKSMAELPDLDD